MKYLIASALLCFVFSMNAGCAILGPKTSVVEQTSSPRGGKLAYKAFIWNSQDEINNKIEIAMHDACMGPAYVESSGVDSIFDGYHTQGRSSCDATGCTGSADTKPVYSNRRYVTFVCR